MIAREEVVTKAQDAVTMQAKLQEWSWNNPQRRRRTRANPRNDFVNASKEISDPLLSLIRSRA